MSAPAEASQHLSSTLRPGEVVFARYRLSRVLGLGGMGVVWLAEDRKLERPVALKFLPETLRLDPASRDELKRETRRSLELTHPNLVRIHDFVEDDELAAIAMEYVDGPTLSELRVQNPSRVFWVEELTAWVGDLCRALDYAHHTACCVHRDLKPSNLMLTARGHLKIADFGISCSLQNTAARVSAWKSTGGTLGYMSPQQLRGEMASPSDDVYAVGATLYELLTGRPPFHSGDISFQVREVLPKPINQQRADFGVAGAPVPALWEEVISSCLAKDPADRPPSAGAIAQRLGLASSHSSSAPSLEAEMLTVRHLPEVPRASARLFKNRRVLPWMISGGSALALALVGALLWSVALPRPATPPATLPPVPTPPVAAPIAVAAKPEPEPPQDIPSPATAETPAALAEREIAEADATALLMTTESSPADPAVPTVETETGVPGQILVESNPSGAEIFCDDVTIGRTPLLVDRLAGAYIIEARYNGQKGRPQAVVVADGQKKNLRFEFERTAETPARRVTRKKAPVEESAFTKVGRSIKNFFGTDKPKKK